MKVVRQVIQGRPDLVDKLERQVHWVKLVFLDKMASQVLGVRLESLDCQVNQDYQDNQVCELYIYLSHIIPRL